MKGSAPRVREVKRGHDRLSHYSAWQAARKREVRNKRMRGDIYITALSILESPQ